MKSIVFAIAGLAVASAAQAQYSSNFERPTYVPGVTTGQDGWTLPAGIDTNIQEYAGNPNGFVTNPTGGNQFLHSTSTGGANFGRAQHAVSFAGQTAWAFSYDFAALYTGTPPSAQNLSSFSIQSALPVGSFRQFIALNNFVDLNNPAAGWTAEYNVFDAAGVALNNQSPGAAWRGLQNNKWYNQTTVVDFTTNQVLQVILRDVDAGTVISDVAPAGWYMTGGLNGTLALPEAVRFFAGGAAGNTMGWDNLNVNVVPAPSSAMLLLGAGLMAGRRRRA